MTKQELEQAIENGESVWYAHDYTHDTEIEQIRPSKNIDFQKKFFYFNIFNGCYNSCFYYERTFKTKAEAEHYLYHANVTRKETLPFVTWEEFKNGKSVNFVCRYGLEYILKEKYGSILLIWVNANSCIASWDLTEQNFYKAYDECVMLFRSGEE